MPERELRPGEEAEDPEGLESLRAAWRELEPPHAFEALEHPDDPTRAVLAWMNAAWRAATPPPARLPWRLRLRRPRRIALRFAAAALVIAAAFLAQRWAASSRREEPVAQPESGSTHAPRQGIRVAHVSEDRTEIRSGPVRLILFSPVPSASATDGRTVEEPR